MHRYRVVENCPDGSRLALRCHSGRYHLARVLSGMPAAGTDLNGDKPHLGFGMLSCTLTGRIFRVMFESINHTGLSSVSNDPSMDLSNPAWGQGSAALGARRTISARAD